MNRRFFDESTTKENKYIKAPLPLAGAGMTRPRVPPTFFAPPKEQKAQQMELVIIIITAYTAAFPQWLFICWNPSY